MQPAAAGSGLRGAGVVVTRPSGTAEDLNRALRRLGAETVALPCQRLRAVAAAADARAALRNAVRGDGMVFVSPAAVKFAWRLLPRLHLPRRLCVAAVGRATAAALRRRGVAQVVQPQERQDSEGLLTEPELLRLRGQHWSLIGAGGGSDRLPQTLRRRGARVVAVEVYERVAPRWTRQHLARLETAPRPLIVLASSARTLAHLATALPAGLVLALRAAELVVSSDRLAALAREHGFTRIHIAASALAADMADACVRALSRHRL